MQSADPPVDFDVLLLGPHALEVLLAEVHCDLLHDVDHEEPAGEDDVGQRLLLLLPSEKSHVTNLEMHFVCMGLQKVFILLLTVVRVVLKICLCLLNPRAVSTRKI